jgi:hypothetical protein
MVSFHYALVFLVFLQPSLAQDSDADGDGWTVAAGDCDDTDASVSPDGCDMNCDLIDQDCDGIEDDDFVTTPIECWYSMGACAGIGEWECIDGVEMETGCILPGEYPEVCNGLDDDCDGSVDEGDVCGTSGTAKAAKGGKGKGHAKKGH